MNTLQLHNPYYHTGFAVLQRPVETKRDRSGRKYRYCVGIFDIKNNAMSPKDFGLSQAGRMCHNSKNKRK